MAHREVELTIDIDVAQEARLMEWHILKEAETARELSVLRDKDNYANEKLKRLLQDYDNLLGLPSEMQTYVQDERKKLQLRLTDLQLQSASLKTKIRDMETQMESIRLRGNVGRKFFLSEVTKVKD
ncbi:hypothetical protein R1flu_029208 [Riccia fluitans]|uniref:Uncharacterized protein n=1 Tax=Riccia fluitans TaxID=41844 RepID=A0ABD1XNX8_9MARC